MKNWAGPCPTLISEGSKFGELQFNIFWPLKVKWNAFPVQKKAEGTQDIGSEKNEGIKKKKVNFYFTVSAC